MTNGNAETSDDQGREEAVHSQSPHAPVQFVVVQQNPADDDRETVGKFLEGLLGTKKEEGNDSTNASARKLTVSLSQHNLIIVIALLILAGSQVFGVFFRIYESKKDKEPQTQQLDLPTLLALSRVASEASQAAAAAQQAAQDAHQAAEAAQKSVTISPQTSPPRSDPDLSAALLSTIIKSSPSPSPVFVPLPYPAIPSAPTSPPTSGIGEHKIPVRPEFAIIPPCFEELTLPTVLKQEALTGSLATDSPVAKNPGKPCRSLTLSDWKSRFSAIPATDIIVHYQNNGKSDLELLDFQAFLNTAPHLSSEGSEGGCPYPKIGYQPWKEGDKKDETIELKLSPFWNSAEKKKAQNAWNKGPLLYLRNL